MAALWSGELVPVSEAQKKRLALRALRQVRKAYRAADTAGESLERWLDGQINRKTRLLPGQLNRGVIVFQAYFVRVRQLETQLTDLVYTVANI